jgi:serine/threonine-protein kinase
MSTSKSQRWRLLVGEGIAPGHVIADKYRLDRIIGTGGMAVVIEAWHRDLQERVAIKLLHRELAADREALARFEREGRAVFPMTSRHVARVLDVGKLPHGVPYIVMELLEGRDLARLVAEGPCAVDTAVDVALEACDALHAAHALGIVHRDLKPENIFLARCPNGVESVKVLDFGVSKIPPVSAGESESSPAPPRPWGHRATWLPSCGSPPATPPRPPTCGRSAWCSTSCSREERPSTRPTSASCAR